MTCTEIIPCEHVGIIQHNHEIWQFLDSLPDAAWGCAASRSLRAMASANIRSCSSWLNPDAEAEAGPWSLIEASNALLRASSSLIPPCKAEAVEAVGLAVDLSGCFGCRCVAGCCCRAMAAMPARDNALGPEVVFPSHLWSCGWLTILTFNWILKCIWLDFFGL